MPEIVGPLPEFGTLLVLVPGLTIVAPAEPSVLTAGVESTLTGSSGFGAFTPTVPSTLDATTWAAPRQRGGRAETDEQGGAAHERGAGASEAPMRTSLWSG